MGALIENKGRPVHERGVAAVPGLYFLGMSWLSRRAPAFIWGVWHDAGYLAERIAAYDGTAPANRMAL
jgi:putative flavoprotein involved in K+ transport